jgi:hypothetical protein
MYWAFITRMHTVQWQSAGIQQFIVFKRLQSRQRSIG